MKTLFVTVDPTVPKTKIKRLENLVSEKVFILNRTKMTPNETVKTLKDVEILVGGPSAFERLDKGVFEKLSKLKLISVLSVGTDVIDLVAARNKGVVVCNAKGANSESVAEHLWGMILSLSKRITEADRNIRFNNEYKFINYLGSEIYGKTLGIIGLGGIGKRVARIAKGFNMNVIGMNKNKKQVKGVQLVSAKILYKKSDIIAVCVPLTDETKRLIKSKEIKIMKKGVILISTSREAIIDQLAVIEGLKDETIGGYGLDLDIMKNNDKNNDLLKYPNVILTPHSAHFTKEADLKTYDICIDNVEAFLKGKPINVVN